MRGHSECQAHVHAARISLHGRVDEFFNFGEGDYLVELAIDFGFAHSQDGAVQIDVFASG